MSYKFDISQRPAEIIWRNSQIALMFVMNILLPVNVKSLKEKYGINLKKKRKGKQNKIKEKTNLIHLFFVVVVAAVSDFVGCALVPFFPRRAP